MENQQRGCVSVPVLFDLRLDPRQSVESSFDRLEQWMQHGALTGIDPHKVSAERSRQKSDNGGEQGDLQPPRQLS